MFCSYYLLYFYCSSKLVLTHAVLLKKNNLKSILCSSLTFVISSIRNIIMITLLIWTINLSNNFCCDYCQNYVFHPKCCCKACLSLKYYIAVQQIMNIKFILLLFYQSNFSKIDFDLRLIFTFQTFVVFKVGDTNIVIDLFHDTFQVLS